MNSLLATAALGIALPALLFLAAAVPSRPCARERAGAGLSLPFGLLFLGGAAVGAGGLPPFPPVAAAQGIGYAAVAAGLLGLAWSGLPPRLAWTGRILFLLALALWTARTRLALPGGTGIVQAVGWAGFFAFAWWRLERRARRVGPVSLHLPLVAVLGGGAALFFLTGSALLAHEGGLLAALAAAGGAAFLLRAPGTGTPSLAAPVVPLFGLLLANAQWFSALPTTAASFLALALVAPDTELWLPENATPAARALLGLGAALLCLGAAVAVSWRTIAAGMAGY